MSVDSLSVGCWYSSSVPLPVCSVTGSLKSGPLLLRGMSRWLLVRRRGRGLYVAFGLGVTSFKSSSSIVFSRSAIFFIPVCLLASSAALTSAAALLSASICALVRRFRFTFSFCCSGCLRDLQALVTSLGWL